MIRRGVLLLRLNGLRLATVLQCALSMMAGLSPFTFLGDKVTRTIECLDEDHWLWDFKSVMASGPVTLIAGAAVRTETACK
jgi:hypothetical protein